MLGSGLSSVRFKTILIDFFGANDKLKSDVLVDRSPIGLKTNCLIIFSITTTTRRNFGTARLLNLTIMPLEAFGGTKRGKGYVAAGASSGCLRGYNKKYDHFNHATFLA